jgi:hypothetical protein
MNFSIFARAPCTLLVSEDARWRLTV